MVLLNDSPESITRLFEFIIMFQKKLSFHNKLSINSNAAKSVLKRKTDPLEMTQKMLSTHNIMVQISILTPHVCHIFYYLIAMGTEDHI